MHLQESTDNMPDIEALEENDYEQMDGVKGRSNALSRTYHGQTKYSQRKRLDLYEYFLPRVPLHQHEGHYEDQHQCPCDGDTLSAEYCSVCQSPERRDPWGSAVGRHEMMMRCSVRHTDEPLPETGLASEEHRVQDYNNNDNDSFLAVAPHQPYSGSTYYGQGSSRSNSTRSNTKSTTTSMSTSEHGFDEDLLQEFNKFEREFQSMNCPSG